LQHAKSRGHTPQESVDTKRDLCCSIEPILIFHTHNTLYNIVTGVNGKLVLVDCM